MRRECLDETAAAASRCAYAGDDGSGICRGDCLLRHAMDIEKRVNDG
jgi:hypothetical protein